MTSVLGDSCSFGDSCSSIFANTSDILDEGFNEERAAAPKISPVSEHRGAAVQNLNLSVIVEEGGAQGQGMLVAAAINSNSNNGGAAAAKAASENDHDGAAAPSGDNNIDGPAKNDNFGSSSIVNAKVRRQEEEATPQQPDQPAFKFQYRPLDFEREYYDKLFNFAQENKQNVSILPPNAAATLFVSSGIPADRLRMIWNMAVLPLEKLPVGSKPPPAMTVGQFRSAVRLIQLFQNRVTAKDEKLRVPKDVMLAPAYFTGVSGVVVPLPWNQMSHHDDATKATPKRRHSASSLKNSVNSQTMNSTAKNYGLRRSTTEEEKKWSPIALERLNSMVAYGAEDDYFMSQNEFLTYQDTFSRHCVVNVVSGSQSEQHVYVDQAVGLFEKSGLDRKALGRLWDVVVNDPDSGKLDEEEFVLMTHLIVCVTRRGLAVPTVLPVPLRIWRKNRFGGQERNQNEFERKNGTHPSVPITVSPSLGDKTRDASANKNEFNNTVNEQRFQRMEKEIQSLKILVDSLRVEIQDLKKEKVMQRGANYVDTTQRKAEFAQQAQRGFYDSTANDDVPNVDVENYWVEMKDADASDRTEASHKSDRTEAARKSSIGVTRTPPSALSSVPKHSDPLVPNRHPPPSMRASRLSRNRIKKSTGMSQNIPTVHPSSAKPQRRNQMLHRSMPPPRFQQTMPVVSNDGIMKSMINGTNDDLALQMQQVNRQDNFDNLMQTTMERVGSSRRSRQSNLNASFKPTQLRKSTMAGGRRKSRRPSSSKSSLIESSAHITRRLSGETQIYKSYVAPSTAAVDLPPL